VGAGAVTSPPSLSAGELSAGTIGGIVGGVIGGVFFLGLAVSFMCWCYNRRRSKPQVSYELGRIAKHVEGVGQWEVDVKTPTNARLRYPQGKDVGQENQGEFGGRTRPRN
jgi:hypothetical protein